MPGFQPQCDLRAKFAARGKLVFQQNRPLAVAHQRPVSGIGIAIRSNHWREVRLNSLPINIVPHDWPLRYSRPKGVPFGNYPAYSCSRHSNKRRVKPVRYRDSDKGRQQ
jgi:hypothetical protein